MKKVLITLVCFLLVGVVPVRAGVISIPLGDPRDVNPDPYIVDVPWVAMSHSTVQFGLENVLDTTRYKDWEFKVAIPQGYQAATQIDTVRYYTDAAKTAYVDVTNVDMDSYGTETIFGQDYDVYYTSTFEAKWEDYGTDAVGGTPGPFNLAIGNPAWVDWFVSVDNAIPDGIDIYASAYDVCVPEPATLCILGMGGLAMLRRRRA